MKQENQDMANWANEHKKWRNSGQEQKIYCKNEGLLLSKFKLGVKKASSAYCDIWFEGKLSVRIETSESLGRLGDLIKGLVR